ncbi:MAG TPA: hypothetical protein VG497_05845 [Kribbella sp.]|nr:hypothetical protein [Kribbella sp.]
MSRSTATGRLAHQRSGDIVRTERALSAGVGCGCPYAGTCKEERDE